MPPDAHASLVRPGQFEPERHFYPRVLNAQMHSMFRSFLGLGNERIVQRYCHLHPRVRPEFLRDMLRTVPSHFRWAGCDLIHVTTEQGQRHMVVIETNSCPSGQKSMPLYEEHDEKGGYQRLLELAMLPRLRARRLPDGELCVLYDKNEMEASGYAAVLADLVNEPVWLAPCYADAPDPCVRFVDGVLQVRDPSRVWRPIRGAFRYVTQRPWARIPVHTRTSITNPVLACLAGGRNKMVAAKAYEQLNTELTGTDLRIRTPETIWDVHKDEIPQWVDRLGGHAVVKVPYSNAGQGVYTITSRAELDRFLALDHRYERFIVQSLIGNYDWSSRGSAGRLYHTGTVPDKRLKSFVADLRCMVGAGPDGFVPMAFYARRAREPLVRQLGPDDSSWDVLGTNLSVRNPDGSWGADTHRLLLMDRKDFNTLGLALDDLIESYVQTVLAAIAIDRMVDRMLGARGRFRMKVFEALCDDRALLDEIVVDG